MFRIRSVLAAAVAAAFVLPATVIPGAHGDGTHPSGWGHLPPVQRNVRLVGKIGLTTQTWGVSDVAVLRDFAYVGAFQSECPNAGVHIVSIKVPEVPVKVGFVSATNSFVGEGVQALPIKTSAFTGDLLVHSNEPCDRREAWKGGASLYDVTNPVRPQPLAIGVGDRGAPLGKGSAHSAHSVLAWQQGSRAYMVLVDEQERLDVDIMDITNPRSPKLIAETGLPRWPLARDRQASGMGQFAASFFHDVAVKKISGHWYMLLSYWDAGWIVLNIDDPRRPRYVKNSTYPSVDRTTRRAAEGNAHQAVWSLDGRYILGANEDLFAKVTVLADTSTRAIHWSGEIPWAVPIRTRRTNSAVIGPSVYGGNGCPGTTVPKRSVARPRPGEQAMVVFVEGGGCTYEQKVLAAQKAGFDVAVIGASHERAGSGLQPHRFDCTLGRGSTAIKIHALCVGHETLHTLFRSTPFYADFGGLEPINGTVGSRLVGFTLYDGTWGDLRLLDARTMRELGAHQIREARSSRYAENYGMLSIHEIKVDPRAGKSLAYASWYGGGLRVMRFGSRGLQEVGAYIDPAGNHFWGTFPVARGAGRPLLAMSDQNYGLYLLEYTGTE